MAWDEIYSSNNGYNKPPYKEFAGKSTDGDPPTGDFLTGSMAHEVDTKKLYAYDRESETWTEQCELS